MKKNIRIWIYSLVVIGAFLMLSNSCKKDEANNDSSSSGTVKDIDDNVYHTVTIGTQVWMVEKPGCPGYVESWQLLVQICNLHLLVWDLKSGQNLAPSFSTRGYCSCVFDSF